jgi:hypothetical protein
MFPLERASSHILTPFASAQALGHAAAASLCFDIA